MDDLANLTTGGAWLSMFSSFLDDLQGQFPGNGEIEAAIVRANDGDAAIVDEFAAAVSGKQALLSAKDPKFFAGLTIAGIDFWPRTGSYARLELASARSATAVSDAEGICEGRRTSFKP